MKTVRIILSSIILSISLSVFAQENMGKDSVEKSKLYMMKNIELAFQFGDLQKNGDKVNTGLNVTLLNFGHTTHWDFTNNVGMFWGLNFRTIGINTKKEMVNMGGVDTEIAKIERDVFTAGIPLALKIGSFKKHGYFYIGGEIETPLFVYQRYYNEHDETIDKQSDWMSTAAEKFIPSLMVGVQAPWGTNIKFKYYLNDIISSGYEGDIFGDYSGFSNNQMMSISISMQMKHKKKYLKKPSAMKAKCDVLKD